MSRLRLSLIAAGVVVVLTTAAFDSYAQQGQGRGRRGQGGQGGVGAQPGGGGPGQRGQGGPGGGGGGGGQGGPGRGRGGQPGQPGPGFGSDPTSISSLLNNDAVQKELKVTDRQKTQLKKVGEDQDKRRRETMENLRDRSEQMKAQQAQQTAPPIDPLTLQHLSADDPTTGALNSTQGFGAATFGGRVFEEPIQAQQQALAQQQQMMRAGNWAVMRESMQVLQDENDQAVLRVLDPKQRERIHQIQLQVVGPTSAIRPDVAERLELREEQYSEIAEVQGQINNARRESFDQSRQLFDAFRQSQSGNNGGQGGRGGFDQEAFKKFAQQPQVKAEVEKMQKSQSQIRQQAYAEVFKILDRRQGGTFRKLLGKEFDVESLNPMLRNLGLSTPVAAKAADPAAKDAAKTKESTSKATPAAKSEAETKPTPSSKRRSLRERRGLGQGQDSQTPQ